MIWYSEVFKDFPQFVVIHTVKSFSIVNEVDVFLEFPCLLYDPANIGNLVSGFSAFSKPSFYIWKFLVHVLLKPSLKDFNSHGVPIILAAPGLRNTPGIDSSWKKNGKNRKLKSKRVKPRDSSGSTGSGGPAPQRPPLVGLNTTAWSLSDTSQSSCPAMPFPGPVPAYSLPLFPAPGIVTAPGTVATGSGAAHTDLAVPVDAQQVLRVHPPPFASPLAPVMALVLPSCSFSPVTPALPPAFFPGQLNFVSEMPPASQPEFFPDRTSTPKQPCPCAPAERGPPALRVATPGTPPLAAGPPDRTSPALFQSRGSSPLQLNLMQLEEAPEGTAAATGAVGTVGAGADCKPGSSWDWQPKSPPTVSTS